MCIAIVARRKARTGAARATLGRVSMTNDGTFGPGGALAAFDGEVARLAARAVVLMLRERNRGTEALELRLRLMCDAFLSEREETRHAIMLRLRQEGVTIPDIIDRVLPEVARYMGRRWAADEISFADVTIGTARLQEVARALSRNEARIAARLRAAPEAGLPGSRGQILLIVPRPEHHTLGIFVAADQFRRFGYGVDVAVDRHPRQIVDLVRRSRYDMIGITAAGRRALASARELVETVRASVVRVPPLVLGGSIVVETDIDARALTGVDHVVADAGHALDMCRLSKVETGAAEDAPQVCRESAGGSARNISA